MKDIEWMGFSLIIGWNCLLLPITKTVSAIFKVSTIYIFMRQTAMIYYVGHCPFRLGRFDAGFHKAEPKNTRK